MGVAFSGARAWGSAPAARLGLMPEGAVRVSLLHYNTLEDVDRLLAAPDALPWTQRVSAVAMTLSTLSCAGDRVRNERASLRSSGERSSFAGSESTQAVTSV